MTEERPPSSLLDTEARIIAENETHAVIAIRIEKHALAGFMQRNSDLIREIADLDSASPLLPGIVKC